MGWPSAVSSPRKAQTEAQLRAELGGAHAVHPAEGAALLRAEAGVEAVLTQGLSRLLRVKDIAAIPAEGHGAVLPHQNTGADLPSPRPVQGRSKASPPG